MNEERAKIISRINELIDKRKLELLKRFPYIHEIEDGIIIRFFTDWDNCWLEETVKTKTIIDKENPDRKILFEFIPKGTIFPLIKREHVHTIICFSGKIDVTINDEVIHLTSFTKTRLSSDTFTAIALEDSYILVSDE
jgi:hypothetical protein